MDEEKSQCQNKKKRDGVQLVGIQQEQIVARVSGGKQMDQTKSERSGIQVMGMEIGFLDFELHY